MQNIDDSLPLVSVIITTYNYSAYLPKAITSVLTQTYTNVELIIIDDGSMDDTVSIIPSHTSIKYFYQENQGLSAARNNGIKKSEGAYIIFLDADDWLEPNAIENNLQVIFDKPNVAFVSGNYYLIRAEQNQLMKSMVVVNDNHYLQLLQSNYIGMLAAVLFQRWVFNEFQFDENLRSCEDYDLYLNITRKYPVMHHQEFIATYYFHNKGLSHNYQCMMESVTAVMRKQAAYVRTAEEKKAYKTGLKQWKDYRAMIADKV